MAFGYQDDPTATWFLIEQSAEPVKKGLIASWDTSTITDGEYQLRVRVILADGKVAEAIVPNLRVRNYTPVETARRPKPARWRRSSPPRRPCPITREAQPGLPRSPPTPPSVDRARPAHSALRGVAVIVAAIFLAGLYASSARRAARLIFRTHRTPMELQTLSLSHHRPGEPGPGIPRHPSQYRFYGHRSIVQRNGYLAVADAVEGAGGDGQAGRAESRPGQTANLYEPVRAVGGRAGALLQDVPASR